MILKGRSITENNSMSMKITAAVLSVVFAGSYMSCVVQNEIDIYKKTSAAQTNEFIAEAEETTAPVTTAETTAVTTTAEVTTVPVTVTSPVTTVTTVTTVTETSTEAVTTTEATTAAPVQTEPPEPDYDYSSPVPENTEKDSSYFDKCAFVGDSHIKGMGGYGVASENRIFAQNGVSITHINDYISVDSISAAAPENIYFMLGTNGVMWLDWDTMLKEYSAFIQKVSDALPSANIYVISIPPVTAERETREDVKSGKYLNSDIDAYNNELLKMSAENEWYYVDVNPVLKNDSGCLISSTDGVHMTKDLYEVFGKYLLSHTVN